MWFGERVVWETELMALWVQTSSGIGEAQFGIVRRGWLCSGNSVWSCVLPSGEDISLAVHGDDFILCGLEEDLDWIRRIGIEIKVRAIMGLDTNDDKEVTIFGRVVRYTDRGI